MSNMQSGMGTYAKWLSGLAVLASLLFVGYELKRNNDFAIVQGQHDLISLSAELKSWLIDPDVLALLMTEDYESLPADQRLVFNVMVGSWFDLYEAAYIARERGILTEEQIQVWGNGLRTLPAHWFDAFENGINVETYVDALVTGS